MAEPTKPVQPAPLRPVTQADADKKLATALASAKEEGKKLGTAQMNQQWCHALGVGSVQEAREVFHLRAENKTLHKRHWTADVTKIGIGLAMALVAIAAANWIQGGSLRQAMTDGAAVASANHSAPYVCRTGERMPDGHVCGVPGTP